MEETLNLYFQGTYSQDDEIQVVAFNLGKEEYAVDILNVQEINRLLNITRVPRSESHIEGVLNLRGNIIPIIIVVASAAVGILINIKRIGLG